jgi:hypothetical protein
VPLELYMPFSPLQKDPTNILQAPAFSTPGTPANAAPRNLWPNTATPRKTTPKTPPIPTPTPTPLAQPPEDAVYVQPQPKPRGNTEHLHLHCAHSGLARIQHEAIQWWTMPAERTSYAWVKA